MQKFWHASNYDFEVGDLLSVQGAHAFGGSTKRVLYFSDDLALASAFGSKVYRVEPEAKHTRHRRPADKQEAGFPTEYEYTTRGALRVLGRATDDEIHAARQERKAFFLKTPEGRAWAKRQEERRSSE